MATLIAILAGASYSAAYIAPKPWCFVALGLSAGLVVWMRML